MNTLEKKIDDLRSLYSGVQMLADSINSETAEQTIAAINLAKSKIDMSILELKTGYPAEMLKPYNPEFSAAAKQILNSFDNVITNHKSELAHIQAELAKLDSQKKISNYQR